MTKKLVQPQDKYVLRLPDGLRDRIKAYADRQGTSMNHEIVRVLEREWPEQWPIDNRLAYLADMMIVLKAGKSDPRIEEFVTALSDTVEGIVTGRVKDVDPDTREAIQSMWHDLRTRESEDAIYAYQSEYTEEEDRTMSLIGRPEKYADLPEAKPNPTRDIFQLREILPPKSLGTITELLSIGDTEAAADVIRAISKDEINERIAFHKLAAMEQYRRQEAGSAPSYDDPFEE